MFDIRSDPGCLTNLADVPEYQQARQRLVEQLTSHLRATGDPPQLNGGEIYETYKRYGKMRSFPQPIR